MGNYETHAKRELQAIGYDLNDKEEGPNKWIIDNLLELLEVFAKQGHSGSSAPYCARTFKKLALFEPLSPLTGEDNEWCEVADGIWQNKRASHVFKQTDRYNGHAYDIHGRVFKEPDGCCYTNSDSHVLVTFPYTPTTEYVDVEKGGS